PCRDNSLAEWVIRPRLRTVCRLGSRDSARLLASGRGRRGPVGGTLVGSIPAAYFTGPPRAIPSAVDGAVVRATASGVAHFGLIDRRIRETTSPLDALHNACHLRLVNGYTQGESHDLILVGTSCYVHREPNVSEFRPDRGRHSWSPPGW